MWFVLALGSAVFFAAQGAAAKRLGGGFHPDVVTWASFVFGLPVLGVALAVCGIPEVRPSFWTWGAVSLVVNLVAIPLYFRALKDGELSVVLPLSALTPLFALLTEFLMLGQRPEAVAFCGVGLIVLGAYLLNASEIRSGLLAPFRALARDRGARSMLAASALWSVSAVADRGAVLAASPVFYLAVFCTAFTVVFLAWLVWRRRPALVAFARRPWPLVWVAAFGVVMALCQMQAVTLALAALVISIKRLAALFGVLLGGLLFSEKGLGMRLAATGLMVAGAALVAFTA